MNVGMSDIYDHKFRDTANHQWHSGNGKAWDSHPSTVDRKYIQHSSKYRGGRTLVHSAPMQKNVTSNRNRTTAEDIVNHSFRDFQHLNHRVDWQVARANIPKMQFLHSNTEFVPQKLNIQRSDSKTKPSAPWSPGKPTGYFGNAQYLHASSSHVRPTAFIGDTERVAHFKYRDLDAFDHRVDWQRSDKSQSLGSKPWLDVVPSPLHPDDVQLRVLDRMPHNSDWARLSKNDTLNPQLSFVEPAVGGNVPGVLLRNFAPDILPRWNASPRRESPSAVLVSEGSASPNYTTKKTYQLPQSSAISSNLSHSKSNSSDTPSRVPSKNAAPTSIRKDIPPQKPQLWTAVSAPKSSLPKTPQTTDAPTAESPKDGPNAATRKHTFRETSAPQGKERWDHRIDKDSPLGALPARPRGTPQDRLRRFKNRINASPKQAGSIDSHQTATHLREPHVSVSGPQSIVVRDTVATVSKAPRMPLTHLPHQEKLERRLEEAKKAEQIRSERNQNNATVDTKDLMIPPSEAWDSTHLSPAYSAGRKTSALARLEKLRRKMNKDTF